MGERGLEAWLGGACHGDMAECTAGYGLIVKLDGEVIHQDSKIIGTGEEMCDSVAAFCGLIAFLQWYQSRYGIGLLRKNELPGATVYSGSLLVVYQMDGRLTSEVGRYMPYFKRAVELMTTNVLWGLFDFQAVRTQANTEADGLAKEVLLSRGVSGGRE